MQINETKEFKAKMLSGLNVTIIVIFIIALFALYYFDTQNNSTDKSHQLALLSAEIIYQDEVLTMSARMYAFTGDNAWKTRYDQHAGLLDAALLKAMKAEPFIAEAVNKTSSVNTKLIAMELKAFQLSTTGEKEQALMLLFSDEYQQLKEAYAHAINSAIKHLQKNEISLAEQHKKSVENFTRLLLIFIAFFLIAWLYMLNYIRLSDKYIQRLAVVDELTGLHNRRAFNETLAIEVNRGRREGRPLLVAMLDIDNFKAYNDTYGHPAGDSVLASIGDVIHNNSKRATEFSFRIGGEEFALIKSLDTPEEGKEWVQSLLDQVKFLRISHKKNLPFDHVTLSAGITVLSAHNEKTTDELYSQADQVLYQAKNTGKNRLVEFFPIVNELAN